MRAASPPSSTLALPATCEPPTTTCEAVLVALRNTARLTTSGGQTVLDHSLQTADLLRQAFPDDVELQLAGLLHDIDSVMSCHPSKHGVAGAEFLAPVFSPDIVGLVRLHVRAKRYLLAVDPEYRARSSAESEAMLRVQGLPLSPEQIAAFENEPLARRAVMLRRADEQARRPGGRVSTVLGWVALLHENASAARCAAAGGG